MKRSSELLAAALIVVGLFLVSGKEFKLPKLDWLPLPPAVIVKPTYPEVVEASRLGKDAAKAFMNDEATYAESLPRLKSAIDKAVVLLDTTVQPEFNETLREELRILFQKELGLRSRLDWDNWFFVVNDAIKKTGKTKPKELVDVYKAVREGLEK